jgi:hypothetical protein
VDCWRFDQDLRPCGDSNPKVFDWIVDAERTMPASSRALVAQLGDVVHDLPAFLTSPLYRRWHRHWGATRAEVTVTLPGDALLRHAQLKSTRAITIDAHRWLLWTKPDGTWSWQLTPTESNKTRLVTRIHAVYDWRHPVSAFLGMLLMEFG